MPVIITKDMTEILQKSAKLGREARHQTLIKSGILAPAEFDTYFSVKGYTVADDLAPFVSHYWIMRWDIPDGKVYRPIEILSQPVTHAFFTADKAFIYGVINGTFDYEARGKGLIAGITFRPGGFYPFLGRSVDQLTGTQTPLTEIFSESAVPQSAALLAQDDAHIVTALDSLLHTKTLRPDTHLAFINTAVTAMMADPTLTTVQNVAKRLGVSERTLQHLFKTYIGVGAKWVIMRVRLLEAVKQAYTTGTPEWSGIAADLGYSSQAHFINDFKRVVGTTPTRFIKMTKDLDV